MKRDAKATRQRILAAAAKLLAEKGYAGLGANALAARAGVGKPLIYRYFGGMEGVAKALAASATTQPPKSRRERTGPKKDSATDGLFQDLIAYGRALGQDRLSRDMLVWALACPDAPKTPVDHSPGPAEDYRAAGKGQDPVDQDVLFALMTAGAVFLLSWRDRHDEWAGVPLKSAADLARLETVMADIIRAVG